MGVKLREECSLRVFGPKGDELRKLHIEKLSDLYCSPYVKYSGGRIKRVKWARHVARMGKMKGAKTILVKKPDKNK
jgi:hypothetical protein